MHYIIIYCNCRCGYLMFSKQTERCPLGKKITLTSKIWLELLNNVEKVKEARGEEKELRLHLVGDKHLILEKFTANGLWYVGVHDLTAAGSIIPFSGLNFDDKEWEMLLSNADTINALLNVNDTRGFKRTIDGKEVERGQIIMYKWKWIQGKKKLSESKPVFFIEDDCKKNAKSHEPVHGSDYTGDKVPSLVIEKVPASPPCKMLLMRQVYICILRGMMRNVIQENCEGCKVASGSQVDHMGHKGCLNEEFNYNVEYCESVRDKVQTGVMVMLFDAARKEMRATPLFVRLLAEAVQHFMSNEQCIDLMSNPKSKDKYLNLFLDSLYEKLF